jgi:hypothetical protein
MNYLDIKNCGPNDEPMCATSEAGEHLYSRDAIQSIGFEIGRRILELFGHRDISNIVFRLRSTAGEVRSVINGDKLPSVELLLALRAKTGASIDWILTGQGPKFQAVSSEVTPTAPRPTLEKPTVIPFPANVVETLAA